MFNIQDLLVLSEALTQYIENQSELDAWESETPEAERAQRMLDRVNLQLVGALGAAA